MTLVFAFGSNLHAEDRRRLGEKPGFLEPRCVAWLPDRRLAFTRFSTGRQGGVLDVIDSPGAVVAGMIDVASPAGLAWLDEKEGVGLGHYRRVEATALTPDGGSITVAVYEVVAPVDFVDPAPAYLEIVREARRQLGFSDIAIDDAATNAPARPLARFFLYGTLLPGERNAFMMEGARILRRRPARVRGMLVDCGTYPALLLPPMPGDGEVVGELIDVEPDGVAALLQRLDPFEGFSGWRRPEGSLYERRLVTATTLDGTDDDDGHSGLAWTWARPGPRTAADDAARIPGGDWRRRGT